MLVYGAGAAWSLIFCLEPEPEPTQFGRSRSRLRGLGLPEQEPPKKVVAPQHWLIQHTGMSERWKAAYLPSWREASGRL